MLIIFILNLFSLKFGVFLCCRECVYHLFIKENIFVEKMDKKSINFCVKILIY